MQTTDKKTRSAVTVYHIAIPHQEEIWRRWAVEIEKFLPRVEIILLEFTTILEQGERERIEQHFNELAQGKASPRLHPVDVLKPALSWATLEEFIHNTGKRIYLERMPALAGELYEQHGEALRENVALFFQRSYREAGKKYREAMELQLEEIELRDAEIARQLDEIAARAQGDILLLLGEDHNPSPVQARLERWEPRRYTNLAREIGDAIRALRAEELDELLFRRIGLFWVEGYWEAAGEAGIIAIERAIRILDSIPLAELKELYDFITCGKRADAFFRAILWLKREGFITPDEL
ncbi:MAG: hypothetical protein EFT35_08930 [Methanophagales archaeon ANME-1-THS]|nr:MAG: hypothetical protein EFT35_08930 [Methanophagales archaeon ANME-1-THS]